MRDLLRQRIDIDDPTRDGATALLWAAHRGDLEMVQVLIAAGADVDAPNRYGATPLLEACRTADSRVMQALLTAGADPGKTHPHGQSPLMAVARTGSVESVRLLLQRRAEVNAADAVEGQTALMWAAAEGHLEVVTLLLAAGANPNAQARTTSLAVRFNADFPSGGFTPLMWAARNGHDAIVQHLLDSGADANIKNGDGASAMTIAIVNDRLDIASAILDRGADANDGSLYHAVEMHDATTDMYALDGSRLRPDHPNRTTALDLIRRLLERGADPNRPLVQQLHSITLCCGQFNNATPFYRAAAAGDVESIRLMIAKGADLAWTPSRIDVPGADGSIGIVVSANQNVGRPAIHVAMEGGKGALIANGPGVHDREGRPPFREASNREPSEALAVLLEAGANPDATSPDAATALHLAVKAGRLDMVRLLAGHGARLAVRDRDGLTPLELAEQVERIESEGAPRRSAYREPDPGPGLAARQAVTSLLRALGTEGVVPAGITPAASRSGSLR